LGKRNDPGSHKPGEEVWWTILAYLQVDLSPPPFSGTTKIPTWHGWMRDKGANPKTTLNMN